LPYMLLRGATQQAVRHVGKQTAVVSGFVITRA
jgi:hypothetical protein